MEKEPTNEAGEVDHSWLPFKNQLFKSHKTSPYVRKWRYLSNDALGSPIDRRTVGWEEFVYRAYSKIWAHFNSDNVYVDRKQEPRYTPSIEVQKILISTFQQLTAGPQLPLNLGRSGKNSSYGGVTFAQPTAIMSPPKKLDLILPVPVNPEIPGFGLPDNIKQLFDEVDNVSRAHVCQGIVTCMVDNQVVEVFADPEQKFETQLLTVLSAHGAADLLALASLDKYGFSDEQIHQILGPPPNWLQ